MAVGYLFLMRRLKLERNREWLIDEVNRLSDLMVLNKATQKDREIYSELLREYQEINRELMEVK